MRRSWMDAWRPSRSLHIGRWREAFGMGIIIFDVEWHVGHMMVSNEHILYKCCLCTVAEILCGSAYMSEVRKGRADANMCS